MRTWALILSIVTALVISSTAPAEAGVKGNGKKVFGYLTFDDTKWTSSSPGDVPVDSLPWDAMTHATVFAASGTIPISSSYYNQIPKLTAKAHATNTFAGLCYGGSGDAPLISTVNTPSSWPAWINYNLKMIDDFGLDFLEFDLENSVTVTNVKAFFTVLYDSLQKRQSANDPSVHPFIVLTVGPSRAASWVSLAPLVAFTNLMSYDYIGDWWGRIIHDCSPKSYQNWNGTGTNTDYYAAAGSANAPAPSLQQAAIRVKNAGWPLDKIVVGFDVNPTYWYGGSFPDGRGPTYIRKPTNGSTQTKSSDLDFGAQWPTLAAIPRDSVHFDQIAQTYWAHTGTSASDDKVWVMAALPGRDSAVWATRQVVDSMNIGGVMFWNLGSEVWSTPSVPPGGRGWFFSQISKHFGGATTPPPPPPPADLTPPSIDLTAPANGATVSGTVTLTATASDNVGVTSVQFSVNGTALGTPVISAPWTKNWNTSGLANGSYVLRATASDGAGLTATDSATVLINVPPPPPDTTQPAVAITAPAAGDTLAGTVPVQVTATDASGVGNVRLYVDGTATAFVDASSPFSFNWTSGSVPDGPHTLGAEATDAVGLKSMASIQVYVKNALPADSIPPFVAITAPAAGDTVGGTVPVLVTASDASGVSNVRLYVDGAPTNVIDGSAPFSLPWSSALVSDGPHTLGAEATDAAGLTSSSSVQVYVKNALPPAPPDTGVLGVYGDSILTPWMNASWGSTNTLASTEQVYDGAYALKTQQNAWGGFSVHSGSWASPVVVNTDASDTLRFAVYPETTGLSLAVFLENDVTGELPTVTRSNIPARQWSVVSISAALLNPANLPVHRLNIQNNTSQVRTYHIDRVEFTGSAANHTVVLIAPAPVSPASGAIDQQALTTISWGAVDGAETYQLQVALDAAFSGLVTDQQGIAGTSFEAGPFGSQTTYYWRVRGVAATTQGPYSPTSTFTTIASAAGLKYDRLFVDFGKVPIGTDKADSVVIVNDGPSQRRIVGVSTNSSVFDAIPGGLLIPAGGRQKLFIHYKPTRKTRDVSRVISIIDSANRTDTVRVVGSGVNPPRQRRPGTVVIGQIPAEEVGTQDIYVGNDGDLNLVISSVTSTTEGISVTPTSATIAPFDSVLFRITVDTKGKGKGKGLGKDKNTISGLLVFSTNGFEAFDTVRVEATIAGGTDEPVPGSYSLGQNYPNPFNPSTTIEFGLPVESRVILTIYNVIGQAVRKYAEETHPAGVAGVLWDGLNDAGEGLPSGIYFYRISAQALDGTDASFTETKRMMLIK